jgi:hypothetical protein
MSLNANFETFLAWGVAHTTMAAPCHKNTQGMKMHFLLVIFNEL